MLPLLKLTDLDQIFTGGTSHHGLPPCKISSKSEQFKRQKFCSKIKSWKKMTVSGTRCPYVSICCLMVRGAAALKGPMTYA